MGQNEQVAALVVFPKGVSEERAKVLMDEFQRSFRNASEEPHVQSLLTFDLSHGGITIYQP